MDGVSSESSKKCPEVTLVDEPCQGQHGRDANGRICVACYAIVSGFGPDEGCDDEGES